MRSLPFYIARRYLFAKKSHKAVNIISLISLFGFCIGTAALVIVMSAFNGFEGLITGMYNQFDPDLKVSPTQGKVFSLSANDSTFLADNPHIISFSEVIEDQALVQYNGKQSTAMIKGVSSDYQQVNNIDSLILRGKYDLTKQNQRGAVVGMGLANTLGMGVKFVNSLVIYSPKRLGRISLTNPEQNIKRDYFFPTGFFALYQPEIDNNYIILDIDKARSLFQYSNELSFIEIHIDEEENISKVKEELQAHWGEKLAVEDRYEQKADLYKMFTMEKWITFFIVVFILIIAIFNIVGTLSMLIIEKKQDLHTLQSMGADSSFIRKIFIAEGRMVALFGALLGLIIGVVACLIQQYFGVIKLGSGGMFIVDAYPIQLLLQDIVLIFITVVLIGSVSIYFPVKYICKRFEI